MFYLQLIFYFIFIHFFCFSSLQMQCHSYPCYLNLNAAYLPYIIIRKFLQFLLFLCAHRMHIYSYLLFLLTSLFIFLCIIFIIFFYFLFSPFQLSHLLLSIFICSQTTFKHFLLIFPFQFSCIFSICSYV